MAGEQSGSGEGNLEVGGQFWGQRGQQLRQLLSHPLPPFPYSPTFPSNPFPTTPSPCHSPSGSPLPFISSPTPPPPTHAILTHLLHGYSQLPV